MRDGGVFPPWMGEAFRLGGGQISVEEFMRLALYEPGRGYYSNRIRTVGRGGDFATSATLHGALGEAIAVWAEGDDLIEIGAGDGALAEALLGSIGWRRRRRVRYHIVDASPPLIASQKSRLSRFRSRIRWHEDVASALRACGGRAEIFSNELVDAFPAQALRWDATRGGWDEVSVREDGAETMRPSDFSCVWQPGDGQRIERHPSYRRWLASWAPAWRAGRMLTIDYGGCFPDLYWRKPAGTLRAYFSQQRLEGAGEFFRRAGFQDLTADVNFSDLMRWGAELGFGAGRLLSQREFLIGRLPGLEARARREPALGFLLDPDGAGGAFSVLEHELPG